jgi:SP family general alpha glucoside:H+ symporter-like MFS transporter
MKRLTSNMSEEEIDNSLALMVETTELERSITEGATYLDCFRGSNLWRTEIACVSWMSQVLVGFGVSSYATYFFEQAGMSTKDAYKLTVGQGGLHFVGVVLSVFITARHGRRSIFIWGCIVMALAMFVIGFVAIPAESSATGGVSAAFYYVWYTTYEMTVGPIVYIIVSEVSATRLRSKTIGLGRNAYNVINIAATCAVPHILNPTAANWKGKSAFLAAGFCVLCATWAWFRLPELKGRTYEELDILFAKNLGTREFKNYQFDHDIELDAKLGVVHKE